MSAHPQVQGFEALEEDPRVERAEGWPGSTQEADHFFHMLAAPGNHTAHATALAIDELGGRMHDNISAQQQRLLQGRRAETVVDDQHRALGVGDLGQRRDVDQFSQGIGRRFDEEHFGVGLDRRVPAAQLCERNVIHLDTKALEVLVEQADGRAENAA